MGKRCKTVLLLSVMIFCMVSCGKKEEEVTKTAAGTAEEQTSDIEELSVTEAEVTEEEAEEVTEKVTEEATETDKTEADKTGEDSDENTEGEEIMGAAKIYYQGHASMRITTAEGKTIYVDPFMGDGYDVPADLILETHDHYDHTQVSLIESKNPDCTTITWKEALEGGEHRNFDLGYVKVEAVEAGYNKNHDVKSCVGYILTFSNGATLYLSGDTSTTPQMKELRDRNLDYAFFCCDGVYNMDMKEAIECAKTVNAKHSIPYHMVPSQNSNGFDRAVAETFDVPDRIIIAPGEELVLE